MLVIIIVILPITIVGRTRVIVIGALVIGNVVASVCSSDTSGSLIATNYDNLATSFSATDY